MTELIEGVSVDLIDLEKHSEDDCPFCNSKDNKPEINENVFKQNNNEDISKVIGLVDSVEGYQHKNCAGTLGVSLGGDSSIPSLKKATDSSWPGSLDIGYAAHHLIPGDGSLVKCEMFKSKKHLRYEGQKEGNIGYNVNCFENGVWLPGNYAYSQKRDPQTGKNASEWGSKGKLLEISTGVKAVPYVHKVISQSERQFHDAHGKYNKFVIEQLDKIHDKLTITEEMPWCKEAEKQSKEKDENKRPLYIIVGKLGHLSNRLRKKLVFPTSNWNINVYTSSFSHGWMNNHNKEIKNKK